MAYGLLNLDTKLNAFLLNNCHVTSRNWHTLMMIATGLKGVVIGKAKWFKYPNHKFKIVCHLNMDNSEIFDTLTYTPKQRCDLVPAGGKHHMPIIIHPPYLCIHGISL